MKKENVRLQFSDPIFQTLLHALVTVPVAALGVLGGSTLVATVLGLGVAGGDGARPGPATDAGQFVLIALLFGLVAGGTVVGCCLLLNLPLSPEATSTNVNRWLAGEYVSLLVISVLAMYIGSVRKDPGARGNPVVASGIQSTEVQSLRNAHPSPSSASEQAQRVFEEAVSNN